MWLKPYKIWIKRAFILIVVVLLFFGGKKGIRATMDYLDDMKAGFEKEKLAIIDSMAVEVETRDLVLDSISKIKKVTIPNYYNKLKRSENEVLELQKELDAIRSSNASQQQLDSLAEHITFN